MIEMIDIGIELSHESGKNLSAYWHL